MIIKQVKQYNKEAMLKYKEDITDWHNGKRAALPFLNMYIFIFDNGEMRKNGYVYSEGNSHKFYLHKLS